MPRSFAALALSSASVCLASLLVAAPVLAQAPPGTGTDMELDPDATPEPPPPPPELPPPQAGEWGVGGGEDDGQYAPKGKTGALKEEEEEKAEAERDKGPLQLGPPGLLVVDTVIGFGDMLVVAQEVDGETTMTVVSFAAQGRYRFGDTWALGVRFPFTNGSVKGPKDDTTDDYSTFALGNLELQIQPTFHLNRRLSVPVAVSFFAPVAAGDLYAAAGDQGARAQAIVNQAASASRGWEETALFASKRAGTSLGAGIQYDRDALHLGVSTKLEIMKKAGGNEPPAALTPDRKGALQDPNTNWVTTVAGRYDLMKGLIVPELRAWLAVYTVPHRQGASQEFSGPQLAIEPRVNSSYPLNADKSLGVTGNLGLILPLGGHLGGADGGSGAKGVRITAGLFF
jgi:hypothetical protein